jgi:hypothetical protein
MSVEVLRLREGIQLDQLQELIKEFVDLKGCPACGLNGFDLRFEIDPRIRYAEFAKRFDHVLSEVVVRPFDIDQLDLPGRAGLNAGGLGAVGAFNGPG